MASAANVVEKHWDSIGFLSGELADCGSEPHYSERGEGCIIFIWSGEDL